jgi:cellulose synthase/poly-beta-1,6-N-acetylglucosamine synthase-like glycosyltransferase
MNDGSTDRTSEIAHRWEVGDPRVMVIDRGPEIAGRGKSAVLNHGYRVVSALVDAHDDFVGEVPADRVLLVIVDADGQLDQHTLKMVSPYFDTDEVGQVQIGVRIGNARTNVLTRMQDMEFVGFSCLVQIARDHIGSSGLGGNGQFTRLSALASLDGEPWRPESLTEDLDLGLRLVTAGWRTRYCPAAYVYQQGLTRWRPLLRQRTRWIQGHYQRWRHIPSLARARGASILGRVDLMTYLVLVITVSIVSVNVVLDYLSRLGVVQVVDYSLSFIPYGLPFRVVALVLAFLPLTTFMITYQRHSSSRLRWWEVPAYGALFTLYTYVWIAATVRAWFRMVTGRRSWTKTPRVAVTASYVAGSSNLPAALGTQTVQ